MGYMREIVRRQWIRFQHLHLIAWGKLTPGQALIWGHTAQAQGRARASSQTSFPRTKGLYLHFQGRTPLSKGHVSYPSWVAPEGRFVLTHPEMQEQ